MSFPLRSLLLFFLIPPLATTGVAQSFEFQVLPQDPRAGQTRTFTLEAEGIFQVGDYVDWVFAGTRYASGWTEPQVDSVSEPAYAQTLDPNLSLSIVASGADTILRATVSGGGTSFGTKRVRLNNATVTTVAHARALEGHVFRPSVSSTSPLDSEFFATLSAFPSRLHLAIPGLSRTADSLLLEASVMDSHYNLADFDHPGLLLELRDLQTGLLLNTYSMPISQGVGAISLNGLNDGSYFLITSFSAPVPGESNPFIVSPNSAAPVSIQWGDLQVHAEHSQDAMTITWTEMAQHCRDVAFLDFIAATDHDFHYDELPGAFDQMRTDVLAEERTDFTIFPGYEWTSEGPITDLRPEAHEHSWGHRQVIFRNPLQAVVLSSRDPAYEDLPEFLNAMELLAPDGFLAIPHHCGGGFYRQYIDGGPWWGEIEGIPQSQLEEFSHVMEIYSDLGAAESRHTEDPWRSTKADQEAFILNRGYPSRRFKDSCADGRAFGVVGSSDGHSGFPGMGTDRTFARGLSAVYSDPGAVNLFDAIHGHQTYATSGARIILAANLEQTLPGTTISAVGALMRLDVEVAATAPIARVVLVMDGVDGPQWSPPAIGTGRYLSIEQDLSRQAGVYYLRVEQEPTLNSVDGERAWTSPWLVE